MDDLRKSLICEYIKLNSLIDALSENMASLPIGYFQKKKINGREYYYLQHREGKKIKTQYIKSCDYEDVKCKLQQRKDIEKDIKIIEKKMQAIEVLVGDDLPMIMKIRQAVANVVKDYSMIKKITLFGSRAESRYREDSDVDLLFESNEPVSLMTQTEIRQKLEKELGLSVDLVHGPLNDDSIIEVNGEVEVYAA